MLRIFQKHISVCHNQYQSPLRHYYTAKKLINYSTTNQNELPSYVQHRLNLWEKAKETENSVRKFELPEYSKLYVMMKGKRFCRVGMTGRLSPSAILKNIEHPQQDLVAALFIPNWTPQTPESVPNESELSSAIVWELNRPLESGGLINFIDFESPLGKSIFWHSSAHVLGQALEEYYKEIYLCDGPPLDANDQHGGGFFYEFQFISNQNSSHPKNVTVEHFVHLEEICRKIIEENEPIERLEVTKEIARKMFEYNPFKLDIINSIPDGKLITIYKSGRFIDLCRGPHLSRTGIIRVLTITKTSSSYWKGDAAQPPLQRVYGISFPTKQLLTEWKKQREEIQKRDHRLIGKSQQLFMFNPLSPGSVFFLPHGTRIYNRLVEWLRKEYVQRGYQEVITPLIFDQKLWEQSGHWQHYRENMFIVSSGEHFVSSTYSSSVKHQQTQPQQQPQQTQQTQAQAQSQSKQQDQEQQNQEQNQEQGELFGLKPMNCPGHCLIFSQMRPSYKDLPIRLADFSPLHRNEKAGALTGLTRLRRFSQDDAHIFCTQQQIATEVDNILDMVDYVYKKLGFDYEILLSTRPQQFIGDIETWNTAEEVLKKCLEKRGLKYSINPGDGAFYGPKIDFILFDALRRKHQCATIQLDFQLPQRFGLKYVDSTGTEQTPVMIHRAILGSLERMIAVLTEHTGGKWPFWLSPRQVAICTITDKVLSYATAVYERLKKENFYVELFGSNDETLPKKIRTAQIEQYNFILVIGEEEMKQDKVNVRTRDGNVIGLKAIDQFVQELKDLDVQMK
jgi:threonyl-tRNA synthetase